MKTTMRILLLAALVGAAAPVRAQTAGPAATARYLESVRHTPGLLLAMLREMPKGGDLHNHLGGAVYAESMIDWAAQLGLCIRTADMQALPGQCDTARGLVRADSALKDDDLRGHIIDAWSMRNWRPERESGHDHFFATFRKFGPVDAMRGGEMLAEVAQRAAADHVSYLELMWTPNDGALDFGARTAWTDNLADMRSKLDSTNLASFLTAAHGEVVRMIERKNELLGCGSDNAQPGCGVEIRFLYQVLRGLSRSQVFAQIVTGLTASTQDSLFVGVNMVMPEDGYVSMRDFSLHMRMIDYLRGFYPNAKLSLHAGELAPGLVPPEGLRFHIRESVERGHASRIGHGVDVMHEDDAVGLLREMAKRTVAVEICLTSNDVILGVSGREHPLAMYQRYGVPTLLATDDEGVARSDMTLEYKRAVEDQGLGYTTLKQMARNSIKYSFVQDAVKARLLAQLDTDFATFEAKWH